MKAFRYFDPGMIVAKLTLIRLLGFRAMVASLTPVPAPRLEVLSVDTGTGTMEVQAHHVPVGKQFSLLHSNTLDGWNPFTPEVIFDSTTSQPLSLPLTGSPPWFVRPQE